MAKLKDIAIAASQKQNMTTVELFNAIIAGLNRTHLFYEQFENVEITWSPEGPEKEDVNCD